MKEYVALDELIEYGRNIAYGIVQPGKPVDHGIPMIRVNNFDNGRIELSNIIQVSPEIEEKYSRTRLQGNEILLTLVGSVGQTALVDENMKNYNVARAVAVIPIKSGINRNWVKYYLDSNVPQQYFKEELNTTVQATLNLKSVKKTPIWIPDDKYIEKAVATLSSIDRKIYINNRSKETLENLISAIYYKTLGIYSFSNDNKKVLDSWFESNVLDNITEVREKNKDEKNYPVLSVVKEGEFKASEDVFTKQVYSKSTKNYKIVRRNQVAYNPARANIGSIAMLKEYDVGLVSPIYTVFQMKDTITPTFFYYYMKQPIFQEMIKHHAIGTTRQNFPFEAFKMFPMVVPPMELQLKFEEMAKPIEQKIAKLKEENEVLAEIRDTLLPKLMSGEMPVEVGEN
ncbi:MAG: restriction endonuclease subunit S [Faecalicoccus sp.]|uniref:restriction endonuclease subunit S n=2 Tax=Bacillota TaxID=1239 RepID=UPI002A918C27|nr:restriction endonuclease subunit S [Faecalicoccus sp.]MDY5233787.1 restriction endonuclease subunit S [Faecalicoccus sp.]